MINDRASFMRQFNLTAPSPTRFTAQQGLSASAVLIALVEESAGLQVVFTQRTSHLRHHAGQICFPGGRQEDADLNLQATALREFEEELGVASSQVEVVGQLPQMPVISRFMIQPYIGFLTTMPHWQPDPGEVSEVFTVPLNELLQQQQHFAYRATRLGMQRVWFIPWQQRLIWGATAGIVRSLAEQLLPQHKHLYRPLN
ncbi:MAG: CoA pyrophosphatase [Idiomarina sp.]|nr:CoA pyrophosphatase [Idiomarina sp.]